MTFFKNKKAFPSFSVDDLEKAKKFYGNTLGIDISESKEGLSLYPKSSNAIFISPKLLERGLDETQNRDT
jgi:catechol 2,3-dioxygenase-like lactoylglutathione lyase family enzyme